MNVPQIDTPNYVLLSDKQRIGPQLLTANSGQECFAIYGFSDKLPYDAFCKNSDLALMPYPLVKGYLQNQLESAGDTILIIAIDAAGPDAAELSASTMQAVLEAHKNQSDQVAVSYRLIKGETSAAYRVEKCVPSVSP